MYLASRRVVLGATTRASAAVAVAALAVAALVVPTFAVPAYAQSNNVEVRRNVEYAKHDGVALVGDLYQPAAPGKYPVIIGVHGGGWQGGSKAAYQFWGPWLAQLAR